MPSNYDPQKRSREVANDAAKRVRDGNLQRAAEWHKRRQSSPGLVIKLLGALLFGLVVVWFVLIVSHK
jgi:hypothetical protein